MVESFRRNNRRCSSTSITSKVLGTGATLLQSFAPLDPVCQHICGFHIYSGEPKRQVEAHHYCMHLNEDMRQCLIFDGHQEGARLIGVEYIISRKLFEALPEEEKKYWHSHVYEVKGGVIHMPSRTGVPRAVIRPAEKAEMEKLVDTYGKTFHFWQIDRGDPLPYGPPQLMMALTNSSMDNPTLMKSRDERFKVSLPELRKEREYIPAVEKAKGCDTWEKGQVWQLQLVRK
ncbi:hypothetical protein BKA69DRAFT_1109520 [Paraphysoderma sedebokerense]|nr:hypothetical protein BKA69DRAFT_1109520 [Paraphysoderma sedebokerense]